jgi:hypothetical protein
MRSASEKAAALCVTTLSKWSCEPAPKKDFETARLGVFATPGLPLAHFLTAESGLKRHGTAAWKRGFPTETQSTVGAAWRALTSISLGVLRARLSHRADPSPP